MRKWAKAASRRSKSPANQPNGGGVRDDIEDRASDGQPHRISGRQRALAGALTAALAGSLALAMPIWGADPDQVGIRAAIAGGLRAEQHVPALRASAPFQMNATDRAALQSTAAVTYAEYFTGDKLAFLDRRFAEFEASPVEYLDGGVAKLKITSVHVYGLSATATATATVWASMRHINPGRRVVIARPSNTTLESFTLRKINGRWLVDSEQFTFLPGTGP